MIGATPKPMIDRTTKLWFAAVVVLLMVIATHADYQIGADLYWGWPCGGTATVMVWRGPA